MPSIFLSEWISEIYELLQNRAEVIAGRLTNAQQSTHAEVADFLLLQLTNRYVAIFSHINQSKSISPEELYVLLIQLMAEMSTYTKDHRRYSNIPPYHHATGYDCLNALFKDTRQTLSLVLEQHAQNVPLMAGPHGIWIGKIEDCDNLSQAEIVIAISAETNSDVIRQTMPTQIKISDTQTIEELVRRSLPGIAIKHLVIVPRQIPFETNCHYFMLDKNNPHLETIKTQGDIAIHISGHFPELSLKLWVIKG